MKQGFMRSMFVKTGFATVPKSAPEEREEAKKRESWSPRISAVKLSLPAACPKIAPNAMGCQTPCTLIRTTVAAAVAPVSGLCPPSLWQRTWRG